MLESGLGILIHRVLGESSSPFHLLHRWEGRKEIKNPDGERTKTLDGERTRERRRKKKEKREMDGN